MFASLKRDSSPPHQVQILLLVVAPERFDRRHRTNKNLNATLASVSGSLIRLIMDFTKKKKKEWYVSKPPACHKDIGYKRDSLCPSHGYLTQEIQPHSSLVISMTLKHSAVRAQCVCVLGVVSEEPRLQSMGSCAAGQAVANFIVQSHLRACQRLMFLTLCMPGCVLNMAARC